jgi:methylated-DNA-[protein]-cysteine S-methyltransferase
MSRYYTTIESPVGPLTLGVGDDGQLLLCSFGRDLPGDFEQWVEDESRCATVRMQLEEYFAGIRNRFDVELAPQGTEFQRAVWSALSDIPYGETVSYSDIARSIGRSNAVRAVGAANGANPIAIIVPCHRVIGRNGSLVGYGGGMEAKKTLLALEQKQLRLL